MDPISIALGLAQFAPMLMKWLGAGDKSIKAAETAIDIAKTVSGAATGEEALEIMRSNTEAANAFRLAVMSSEKEIELAYLSDVQNARARDAVMVANNVHNYRADSMYVLAVVVIVALVYMVWKQQVDDFVKGVITLVLGRFLGYLDNIYNFEFGTTRASRTKDETLRNMSKGD